MAKEKDEEKLMKAYQSVFVNNPDGEIVLLDMLNDLGAFATDQRAVEPNLIAYANLLKMKIGIYDTGKGLQRYVSNMIRAAKGES